MKTYQIYGLGAALVDTEIEIDDSMLSTLNVEKGIMTLVDADKQASLLDALADHNIALKLASGGSAANSIIAAASFGASTHYSCKVADDKNGRFYLNDLSEAGVHFSEKNILSEEGVTGKCLVFVTPDAERTMNTFLGISETLSTEQIDERAVKSSEWVYIEGYLVTSETGKPCAIKLRELANTHGVKTSFSLSDPAMVQFFKSGLEEIIGDGVDLLFCNEAEALSFAGTESLKDAEIYIRKIAKSYAITLGAKGARVYDGEKTFDIIGHKVKALDTNGAGDMFAGAFLYALSQGKNFEQAGKLASLAASRVVAQFGPRLKAIEHQAILEQANI